ncbi:MAG: hypothetical protein QXR88_02375 [Candidatus Pacearchaeota archaeon]
MKIKQIINLFLLFVSFICAYKFLDYKNKREKLAKVHELINEAQRNYFLFVKYEEMKDILKDKNLINLVDRERESLYNKLKDAPNYLIENYYDDILKLKELSKVLSLSKKLNNLDDIILAISLKEKNFEIAKELIFEKIIETRDEKYIDMIDKLEFKKKKGAISLIGDPILAYKKAAYEYLFQTEKDSLKKVEYKQKFLYYKEKLNKSFEE